ncbi:hypothetical protein TI03_04055, partial [Achromatium sp. WMS1]
MNLTWMLTQVAIATPANPTLVLQPTAISVENTNWILLYHAIILVLLLVIIVLFFFSKRANNIQNQKLEKLQKELQQAQHKQPEPANQPNVQKPFKTRKLQ